MSDDPRAAMTELLQAWSGGDREALAQFALLAEPELRRRAASYLRGERAGHSLQPTDLLQEMYIRMINQEGVSYNDRTHFFAIAATVMRRILVEHARRHNAQKRGGGEAKVTLDENIAADTWKGIEILELDRALERLAEQDAEKSRIVELRFFGGLTVDEVSDVMGTSRATVNRHWAVAKAWLYRELSQDPSAEH